MTSQSCTVHYQNENFDERIIWNDEQQVLDSFFNYFNGYPGYSIVFGFNLSFDLALTFRMFSEQCLQNDFIFRYGIGIAWFSAVITGLKFTNC